MHKHETTFIYESVARINITIDDELEKQLRTAIFHRSGLRRGDVKAAIEEAIRDWVRKGAGKGPR